MEDNHTELRYRGSDLKLAQVDLDLDLVEWRYQDSDLEYATEELERIGSIVIAPFPEQDQNSTLAVDKRYNQREEDAKDNREAKALTKRLAKKALNKGSPKTKSSKVITPISEQGIDPTLQKTWNLIPTLKNKK